jgi:hypothetical protein
MSSLTSHPSAQAGWLMGPRARPRTSLHGVAGAVLRTRTFEAPPRAGTEVWDPFRLNRTLASRHPLRGLGMALALSLAASRAPGAMTVPVIAESARGRTAPLSLPACEGRRPPKVARGRPTRRRNTRRTGTGHRPLLTRPRTCRAGHRGGHMRVTTGHPPSTSLTTTRSPTLAPGQPLPLLLPQCPRTIQPRGS